MGWFCLAVDLAHGGFFTNRATRLVSECTEVHPNFSDYCLFYIQPLKDSHSLSTESGGHPIVWSSCSRHDGELMGLWSILRKIFITRPCVVGAVLRIALSLIYLRIYGIPPTYLNTPAKLEHLQIGLSINRLSIRNYSKLHDWFSKVRGQ